MRDITQIPIKPYSVAGYEKHLAGLSPGVQAISLAKTQRLDLCIVFGLREDDREVFSAHELELIGYLHEEYLAGMYRPKPGSGAAFLVAMVEEMAGGKPAPHQRDELCKRLMLRCLDMLKNRHRKGEFVPASNIDPKRNKFLDDLEKLGGQP
jgi:hypothetical protein